MSSNLKTIHRAHIELPAFFTRLPGLLNLILQRRLYHSGLTILALFGVVLAVGLVTSASFFSEAVDRAILFQELDALTSVTGRPPFSTSVYVFPSSRIPVPMDQAERMAAQVENILTTQVGLPARQVGLLLSSGGMMLRPRPGSQLYSGSEMIGNARVVYIKDISSHLSIVAGDPLNDSSGPPDVLNVWVHDKLAQEMNLQPGDELSVSVTLSDQPTPLRVAGIWKAADPDSDFWFSDPDVTLKDAFLVRREDYIRYVQPMIPSGSREASWYIILDESKVIPKNASQYIAGFSNALKEINRYLPGARLNSPPLDALKTFVTRSATLTVILLAYNLPAFGILLYFLMITATIMAQWQRRETAILASRGMNPLGLLNLTLLEQLILFIIGFPLGVGFGMLMARLMSYTTSFLSFTIRPPLTVTLHGINFSLVFLALGFILLSRLIPTLQAARSTVVTEEREWSRPMRTPFWYRYYLDFLLILPTWYAYDQMSKRGSLAGLITKAPTDLLNDPLLILVPALFVLVAALITMRLFGLVMRLIDLLASQTPWVTLHLALRQLGRQSQDYIRPLLLVIISLAIGVYTISMAASLDRWLVDRMSYQAGADLSFTPQPLDLSLSPSDGNWIPVPGDFEQLPGVRKATRVGEFLGRVTPPGGYEQRTRLMAIDRLDFPQVSWWRKDFAPEPLGALMNRLALASDAALVSRTFLENNHLNVGDKISVLVSIDYTVSIRTDLTIVGVYDYFPTAYEDNDGVTVVTNMDYLVDLLGYIPMHRIWLSLTPGTRGKEVMKEMLDILKIHTLREYDRAALIASEKEKLERVGVFGTLTTGFLATAVMAVMGLLVYSYASLRERVYRFAVLNALGLLRQQIIQQVITEYTFLSVFGAAAGAWIGINISRLFVPFFRYTGEKGVPMPPILPVIAENQVLVLAAVFTLVILAAEMITIMTVFRQQLARLIKTINQ
jgi:putative ABC transport system permease protein